jgi:anti-sigma B factor antagonist
MQSCSANGADVDLTERQTREGGTLIAIHGELDAATAPRLRGRLLEVINNGGGTTIDLGGCTFIDSTGLAVIIEAGHVLDERLERLRIVNLRDQPKQLFDLTLVAEVSFIQLDAN